MDRKQQSHGFLAEEDTHRERNVTWGRSIKVGSEPITATFFVFSFTSRLPYDFSLFSVSVKEFLVTFFCV